MLESRKIELKSLLKDIRYQLVDWVNCEEAADVEKLCQMQEQALELGFRLALCQIFERESFDKSI